MDPEHVARPVQVRSLDSVAAVLSHSVAAEHRARSAHVRSGNCNSGCNMCMHGWHSRWYEMWNEAWHRRGTVVCVCGGGVLVRFCCGEQSEGWHGGWYERWHEGCHGGYRHARHHPIVK